MSPLEYARAIGHTPRRELGFDERTDGAYSTPRSDSARSTGSVRRPVIGSQSIGTSRSSVHSPSERRRVNGYAAARWGPSWRRERTPTAGRRAADRRPSTRGRWTRWRRGGHGPSCSANKPGASPGSARLKDTSRSNNASSSSSNKPSTYGSNSTNATKNSPPRGANRELMTRLNGNRNTDASQLTRRRDAPRVQLSTEARIWRSVGYVALVGERAARSRASIYPWR